MGPESVTGLTYETFRNSTLQSRVIILYPWANHRTAFMSHVIHSTAKLIYYRLTPNDRSISDWIDHLYEHLMRECHLISQVDSHSLDDDDLVRLGTQLASQLKLCVDDAEICYLYLDEFDHLLQDQALEQFMNCLLANLDPKIKLIVSSRVLCYQPWYSLVMSGDAVVLGTEHRANDGIFTVTPTAKPPIEVYALGRGYAFVNGQEITNWDGALPRNLFFYFIDNPMVTRDQVFQIFWSDLSSKEATNVFHVTKRKISERITEKVDQDGNYELTQYSAGFYTPSEKVNRYYDVHEFEQAIQQAMRTIDEDEEEALLQRAISLYRGPFLHGNHMEWVKNRRNELRQLYAQALIGMGRLAVARHDRIAALGYFTRALKETPEREDVHRDVMSLYSTEGMINEALRQYRLLERTLSENFNIKPSPESRRLYERIRTKR